MTPDIFEDGSETSHEPVRAQIELPHLRERQPKMRHFRPLHAAGSSFLGGLAESSKRNQHE
jgi:hypothetical protein